MSRRKTACSDTIKPAWESRDSPRVTINLSKAVPATVNSRPTWRACVTAFKNLPWRSTRTMPVTHASRSLMDRADPTTESSVATRHATAVPGFVIFPKHHCAALVQGLGRRGRVFWGPILQLDPSVRLGFAILYRRRHRVRLPVIRATAGS